MASAFRKTSVAAESLTPEYRVAPERSEWQEEAADLTVKGSSPRRLPSVGIQSSVVRDEVTPSPVADLRASLPEQSAGDASVSGGVALRLREVGKRFGDKRVLSELSLDIEPGAFVAIVGRSGCGKSTLLRLLSGLDTASEGELTRAGGPVRDIDADTRFMFQEARLLPWQTVIDNVKIGLAGVPSTEAERRARAALELVGLADRAGDWPSVLSGGQRQRVALARALVGQPHLLLFDEPLGALDALTRIEMQQLIESLWTSRGFTAVLVTHDVSEAVALADRVILIEAGRIALDIPITLARPRVKDSGFAHFEQLILSRVLQTDGGTERSRERSDFDI